MQVGGRMKGEAAMEARICIQLWEDLQYLNTVISQQGIYETSKH